MISPSNNLHHQMVSPSPNKHQQMVSPSPNQHQQIDSPNLHQQMISPSPNQHQQMVCPSPNLHQQMVSPSPNQHQQIDSPTFNHPMISPSPNMIQNSPLPLQQNMILHQTVQSPLSFHKQPTNNQSKQSPLLVQSNNSNQNISHNQIQSPLPNKENKIPVTIIGASLSHQNSTVYQQSLVAMKGTTPSPLTIQHNAVSSQVVATPNLENQNKLSINSTLNQIVDDSNQAMMSTIDNTTTAGDKMESFIEDIVNDLTSPRVSLDSTKGPTKRRVDDDEVEDDDGEEEEIDCGLLGDIAELTALMESRPMAVNVSGSRNCFSEDHTSHMFQMLPDKWEDQEGQNSNAGNNCSYTNPGTLEERSISAFEPCRKAFDSRNTPL